MQVGRDRVWVGGGAGTGMLKKTLFQPISCHPKYGVTFIPTYTVSCKSVNMIENWMALCPN